jgi:hypothetical protein
LGREENNDRGLHGCGGCGREEEETREGGREGEKRETARMFFPSGEI